MHTLVIAEAGVNHNGSLELAKELVTTAAKTGVDFVKFQTFSAKDMVCVSAPKAEYQKKTTDVRQTQFDMLSKLQLTRDDHKALLEECKIQGVGFLSTAFDFKSFDLLTDLGCIDFIKISSGDLTNLPFIRYVSKYGRPLLLSTGMATLGEIEDAIEIIEEAGTPRHLITVMHCSTAYPTSMEDVNLHAMQNIKAALGVQVGYSDHTSGIEVPIAAVALGATVIEKHFTLNRNLDGPDHSASLEPIELRAMVDGIRKIERALGDGIKRPTIEELKNKTVARKSIVASCTIKANDVFTEDNITTKRPGTGLSPMLWDQLIGRKATRDFLVDELIAI